MRLVLASASPYRRALLQRLRIPFDTAHPDIDESPGDGEAPAQLVQRLAREKAAAVAAGATWALGSDQLAALDSRMLGKPGNREAASHQLAAMSGKCVRFLTAVALRHADGRCIEALDVTEVRFRNLTGAEIARYVEAERPFDCAGSFKAEGLGIALFDAIRSEDPTALVGLPLIATARLLREAGFQLP